ncbi:MAG: deoxyribodipyrimidine photo-lyase [Oleiphilaceae bacterium]|nr:deoxyribodipyrimidine photo-lyase [Oleiphilaceae bacterium]
MLKRNLRLQDSAPFFHAMKSVRRHGNVLPLYIHEPEMIRQPDVSRQHQAFIRETLDDLVSEIETLGGQLLELVGDAISVLERIHASKPITRICTHRETTQNSQFERDNQVRQWCLAHGVELVEFEQNGIARGRQQPLTFPEYFSQSVNLTLKDPTGTNLSERFEKPQMPSCSLQDIPNAQGVDKPLRQTGGRREGVRALNHFFTLQNLNQYPFKLSSPNTGWDGCSRMSTYLAYGVVSDREVFRAVDRVVTEGHQRLNSDQFQTLQDRARFYLDRLTWRRQYIQAFENDPSLETQCMLRQFNGVREAEFDQALFDAWKSGRTGYPYIDAAMRCLHETGWINMRLRATVVSFATMNLWLPTVKVAQYLATEFLDYDPAIHHVIHQVVAGTSTFDGLMVYDPIKQGLDHDADGTFIRRYIPELADCAGPEVHHLQTVSGHKNVHSKTIVRPYPEPVVDHRETAMKAKRRVRNLQKGLADSGTRQIGLL